MATIKVSEGEEFEIEFCSREFGSRPRTVFTVDGETGAVKVTGELSIDDVVITPSDAALAESLASNVAGQGAALVGMQGAGTVQTAVVAAQDAADAAQTDAGAAQADATQALADAGAAQADATQAIADAGAAQADATQAIADAGAAQADATQALADAGAAQADVDVLKAGTLLIDKLKARSSLYLGANARCWNDGFDYTNDTSLSASWLINGIATMSTTEPSSIQCSGGDGVSYSRAVINLRSQSWHMAGQIKVAGAAGSGDRRGVAVDDGSTNNGVYLGLNEAVSATKFSIECRGGGALTASALSTVNYDNNAHVVDVLWDQAAGQLWFSVDYETPILVTSTAANLPADGTAIFKIAGSRAGTDLVYVDEMYLASSR